MPPSIPPTFHLGLCMAGAISAGAYTAGVMDYLLEALDRWEQARLSGKPGVPGHRVMIDLMTGSSAGGMTAPITLATLLDRETEHISDATYRYFTGKNRLYEAWVNLTADEMLPTLLGTGDLTKHGPASVLNSDFIDDIADAIMRVPRQRKLTDIPYIAPDLEICLSLSNLTGIRDDLRFANDSDREPTPNKAVQERGRREVNDRFLTINHRDFGHFIYGNEYQNDGRIPFTLAPNDPNRLLLAECTKATGAFPIGLRWRKVKRKGMYLNQSPLINPYATEAAFRHVTVTKPLFNDDFDYESVNVDGGMLNNEPFEIANRLLCLRHGASAINNDPNLTAGSVLMIDPFPSVDDGKPFLPKGKIALLDVIGQLYSTMRTQLLFKQDEVADAVSLTKFSRFLMAPTRKSRGGREYIGSQAIACGSLDGFGGFIARDFRTHDFQLGRRNCQRFLQRYFCVPYETTNPIFLQGYADPVARKRFTVRREDGSLHLPILPDINPKRIGFQPQVKQPVFPVFHIDTISRMVYQNQDAIEERVSELLKGHGAPKLLRIAAGVFEQRLAPVVCELILDRLAEHGLVSNEK
ncbi:patatin-like phospholipase family protein [Larkinella sp. VNQ87]|uniref:patatin-like phospholipase family protein n=1 Tax=Larkinella sp. VNQ87 TaxID=3400921 RepID=UPI003C0759C2